MTQEKFCQGCKQRYNCQQVYQQLGNANGPPVARRVLLAFLLPLMIFIAALTASQPLVAKLTKNDGLKTAASFLLAVLLTSLSVLIVKMADKYFTRKAHLKTS